MTAVDLNELVRIVREAGARILEVYAQGQIASTSKADASPVTAADLAAHRTIAAGLQRLLPGVPVLSEEDLPKDAADIVRQASRCWLVDPLDGTRDFLARTGEFTVNVALMESGKPKVGVVLAPVSGRLFLASNGNGAIRLDGDRRSTIRTRAMDPKRFIALVSGMHGRGEGEKIKRLYGEATVRPMGSSLKYVTIAEGQADLAFRYSPTSLWDTAAAQCVLEEAGGALVDFQGRPLAYTHGELINPPFVAVGDRSVDVPALVAALA